MGAVLVIVALIAFVIGLIALIRGRVGWARISSRKTAGVAMAAAAVLLVAGGLALPRPSTDSVASSRPTVAAGTMPTSGDPAELTPYVRSTASRTTAIEPNVSEQPAVASKSKSRALALLVAAAKAKAGKLAAARSSSAAAKSASAHAALISAQQSAAKKSQAAQSAVQASAAMKSASSVASVSSVASASSVSAASASSASAAAAAAQAASSAAQASAAGCGAPPNPYGYGYCGTGSVVTSPPADICTYFACIANFVNGKGYMEECRDGTVSMSGGRRGACSYHGGELVAVTG